MFRDVLEVFVRLYKNFGVFLRLYKNFERHLDAFLIAVYVTQKGEGVLRFVTKCDIRGSGDSEECYVMQVF